MKLKAFLPDAWWRLVFPQSIMILRIEKLTRYVAVQVVWGPQAQGISLDLPRNRNHSFLTAVGISAPFQLQPFGSFQQIFGIKWNQWEVDIAINILSIILINLVHPKNSYRNVKKKTYPKKYPNHIVTSQEINVSKPLSSSHHHSDQGKEEKIQGLARHGFP